MPDSVHAFCKFGEEHAIEVEDDVIAVMEYESGARGVFITSTGEAPGVSRLEIACTGGLITLENDVLTISRNSVDARIYSKTTDNAFGVPKAEVEVIPLTEEYLSHSRVLSNFADAVIDGVPLLAEADEGMYSVELANAMIYSTWIGGKVDIPLDANAYQKALQNAIDSSKPIKRTIRTATVDMSKSYA